MMIRLCGKCGKSFRTNSNRSFLCPEHADERRRENQRERDKRYRAKKKVYTGIGFDPPEECWFSLIRKMVKSCRGECIKWNDDSRIPCLISEHYICPKKKFLLSNK